jgi:hypothetical protein
VVLKGIDLIHQTELTINVLHPLHAFFMSMIPFLLISFDSLSHSV